ncbi:OHCU decarboxylase [Yersinia phage vB_YenM_P778]
MQLETNEIESGLVKLLVSLIGHRLSKDSNGRPNVVKAYTSDNTNDKGIKPDQPFVTVHVMTHNTPYGWLLDKYVDDKDQTCYRVAFQIPAMLTAFGKGSHSIITELKQRLEFDGARDNLERLTGTRLLDTGNLPNNYDYLNTDFEQMTPLLISLVVNSVLVDKDGGLIERVIVDGELKYTLDQIPAEYEIHLDIKK